MSDAATLSVSFADRVRDGTASSGDLVGMSLVFDDSTGDYSITVAANPADPFRGSLLVNVNFDNPDTVPSATAFFQHPPNIVDLAAPTTFIVLTGTNDILTSWRLGDRVATSNAPFGGRAAFGSGIRSTSGFSFDFLGPSPSTPAGRAYFAFVVPEPSVSLLLTSGLLVIASLGPRRKR
jgi:hypothetical protein